MVASDNVTDEQWASLAELDEEPRLAQMLARFKELAAASDEERHRRLHVIAAIEYGLPDDKLRLLTLTRLRTLLAMDEEQAKPVTDSYDAVMREMPATAAMRRVGLVQTLVREFTAEEEERLRALIPTVFAGAPLRSLAAEVGPQSSFAVTGRKKKAWWAFWSK